MTSWAPRDAGGRERPRRTAPGRRIGDPWRLAWVDSARARRRRLGVLLLLLAVGILAATIARARAADATAPCGTLTTPPATYAHVIWIWFENKSFPQLVGPPGSQAASGERSHESLFS